MRWWYLGEFKCVSASFKINLLFRAATSKFLFQSAFQNHESSRWQKKLLIYIVWSESVRGDYIKPSEQISFEKIYTFTKKGNCDGIQIKYNALLVPKFLGARPPDWGPFLKTCWWRWLSFLAHRLLSWYIRKNLLGGSSPHTEYVLSPHIFPWS